MCHRPGFHPFVYIVDPKALGLGALTFAETVATDFPLVSRFDIGKPGPSASGVFDVRTRTSSMGFTQIFLEKAVCDCTCECWGKVGIYATPQQKTSATPNNF